MASSRADVGDRMAVHADDQQAREPQPPDQHRGPALHGPGVARAQAGGQAHVGSDEPGGAVGLLLRLLGEVGRASPGGRPRAALALPCSLLEIREKMTTVTETIGTMTISTKNSVRRPRKLIPAA